MPATTHSITLTEADCERLRYLGYQSYLSLAMRTGADPVKLAEADVLEKLYEACERARDCYDFHGDFIRTADLQVLREALAACRQPKEGT